MTPRPYPIGAVVRLHTGTEATVEGWRGPYSAELSDGYVTPVSLIREVVSLPQGQPETAGGPEIGRTGTVVAALDLGSWEDDLAATADHST